MNLPTLEKKINVRRWWWRSIIITLLPDGWLTKKNLQTFKKDQCEEAVVVHEVVVQHCHCFQKRDSCSFQGKALPTFFSNNVRRKCCSARIFTCSWLPEKSTKKQSIITINIMCGHHATQGGEVHKVIVCKNVFFQCINW